MTAKERAELVDAVQWAEQWSSLYGLHPAHRDSLLAAARRLLSMAQASDDQMFEAWDEDSGRPHNPPEKQHPTVADWKRAWRAAEEHHGITAPEEE